ncbi:photosynthetic NDH subunit of lumenal location 1, chloroplastic isoform X3 [Coffea arabica]|uniref:Photosynthetic NDH subunit of lumenal location 1, chloroplastic isoform X3 n=1 Tax=Coffea arabica TaxID=13443 RepID=A0ABM4WE53_COFAR
MAVSSMSLSLASTTTTALTKGISQFHVPPSKGIISARPTPFCTLSFITCSRDTIPEEERSCLRRSLLLGVGVLSLNLSSAAALLAQGIPKNYEAFVDKADGYSYFYPSDWRDFDFRGHDSAFKDRYLQLQNVRLSFIPTDKSDVHDLGPLDEKNIEGRNYYTFEYVLTSSNFARAAFATIAIGNGRYYTLIVGANERRWRRVRNQLKVVADSFKLLDI